MKMGYWKQELVTARFDLLLLGLSFATAIVDAYTFNEMGIFVANMTGNSVFLGLGTAGIMSPHINPIRSILALVLFCFGAYLSGRGAVNFGPKTRFYLFSSWIIQSLLILLSALLLFNDLPGYEYCGVILPMALAFGLQASSVRPLGLPGLTTVVITSALCDMFSDPHLLKRNNLGRNQRAAFVLLMFLGSLVGGLLMQHIPVTGGAWSLALAAIIKFCVALFLLLLSGKEEEIQEVIVEKNEKGKGPDQIDGNAEKDRMEEIESVSSSKEDFFSPLPSSSEKGGNKHLAL